jgi:hypothetical protein
MLIFHFERTMLKVRRGDVLLLTILCIIEVLFFVSSAVLKSPPERKSANRWRSL